MYVRFIQTMATFLSLFTMTAMSIERYFVLLKPMKARRLWTKKAALRICVLLVILSSLCALPRPLFGDLVDLSDDPEVDTLQGDAGEFSVIGDLNDAISDVNTTGDYDNRFIDGIPDGITDDIPDSSTDGGIGGFIGEPTLSIVGSSMNQPVLFTMEAPEEKYGCFESTDSVFSKVYGPLRLFVGYIIPLVTMSVLYGKIAMYLSGGDGKAPLDVSSTRVKAARKRAVRMLVAMVVSFALLWLPFHVSLILKMSPDWPEINKHMRWVTFTSMVMLYGSTISNPVLFTFMNAQFREGFYQIFCCCCRRPLASEKITKVGKDSGSASGSSDVNPATMPSYIDVKTEDKGYAVQSSTTGETVPVSYQTSDIRLI